MFNLKSKTNRSSSTLLSGINKQNNIDLVNRLYPRYQKKQFKLGKVDSKQYIDQNSNREKEEQNLNAITKRSNYEVNLIKKDIIAISKKTQVISIDVKKIQNLILKDQYSENVMNFLNKKEKICKVSNVLTNHNIPQQLRSKMVDWMIEVISSYKFTEYAFFTAIRIMDTFFMKTKHPHEIQQLHLTGVASIFIACKYEQIYPLKAKVIHEKIAHKKLSKQQIINKQSQILYALNFDLLGVNHYEILLQLIQMSSLQNDLQLKYFSYLKKICLYLCKMVLHDVELASTYTYSILALSCLYIGFKILEQVNQKFSPDENIRQILVNTKENESQVLQAAAKILNLAKTFHKIYPNLQNLKKFNSFSFSTEDLNQQ